MLAYPMNEGWKFGLRPSVTCVCFLLRCKAVLVLVWGHWQWTSTQSCVLTQQIIDRWTKRPGSECTWCRFVNRSAYMVQEEFSLARAYALFTSMGVRHLVVVDELNRARGIITRKDLAPEKLDSAHHRRETRYNNGGARL